MKLSLTLFLSLFCLFIHAQMTSSGGTLYGNEWVDGEGQYLRISVAEDGMYTVSAATLAAAGLPAMGQEGGERLQLWHEGEPTAYRLHEGGLSFFGRKNRGGMDAHLFEDPDNRLNPRYSIYNDTAAYYLHLGEAAGLRYTAEDGPGGGTPTPTIQRTAERVMSDHQSKRYTRPGGGSTVIFSHYEPAEGYGMLSRRDLVRDNDRTDFALDIELPNAAAGTAELEVRFGLAFDEHRQLLSIDGRQVGEVTGKEWSVETERYTFTPTGDKVALKVSGRAGPRDKANIAYVRVRYPAAPVLEGDQLHFRLPAGGPKRLSFGGGRETRLYDLTRNAYYEPAADGAFNLPGATVEREFVLVASAPAPAATRTTGINPNLPGADTDYLILTSRRLTGAGLDDLARYRASAAGGGYRVHTAYVEDLYDAFGYGIARHPQALRNYLAAARAAAPGLRYLFLIGKGREYNDLRGPEQLAEARSTFFVPGFGLPASDNLLSAKIGTATPLLATGRLAAMTPDDIAIYAKKLREVERQVDLADQTIEDLDWMKQALFLGGGQTPGEQSSIRFNLGTMEEIFENSRFGGNVSSVFRTSSEPIESSRQREIFERINAGTSIITFYGHSSTQGFDFNIDNPENYENKDRYPFMMSLGCYSGDAFTSERSIGERFIFLPDGGAVTYAASKGLGYLPALATFGRSVFDHIGNEFYGQGIGDVMQASVAEFDGTSNFTLGILIEQFSLNGDPAFRFHPRPGPDLVVDPATVTFAPSVVPATDSTFNVAFTLLNLGSLPEATADSMTLRFRQSLPSGEIRDLSRRRVAVPAYDERVSLRLPTVGYEAVGVNRLLITVDADDEVTELPSGAEDNNEVRVGGREGVPFTIIANTARAAFPPDYAVVGPGVELVANTSDPLAPERDYHLQISTDVSFRPLLADERLTAPGGVFRYQPGVSFQDSTTYYWRISPDSTGNIGALWSQSNFTYLADQPNERVDYALQHAGQFVDGQTETLLLDADNPEWNFTRTSRDIEIYNGVYEDRELPRFVTNGTRLNSPHPWKIQAGVQLIVIDSINNNNWYSNPGDGAYNTPPGSASPWIFDTRTPEGREGLIRFLQEGIEKGKYVFLWSIQRGGDIDYHNEGWAQDSLRLGTTVYQQLEAEGAEQVRLLQSLGSVPYTFVFQKGMGALGEVIADSQDAKTDILVPIFENWQYGRYTTPPVGRALEWTDLNLSIHPARIGESDQATLRLIGHDVAGGRAELLTQELMLSEQLRYTFDLSDIDATRYPYLSVDMELEDELDRTALTVDEIYFRFRRTGDVAVSPSVAYSLPDSLMQGQSTQLTVGYENLSATPMDSLLVRLEVIDDNNRVASYSNRQPPLPGRGSDRVTFEVSTNEITGGARFQLTLNPDDDQPEDILFNNFLGTDIDVDVDRIAPDLKVYYDGRRIRDGELVSSRPEILVQLRDESPVARLDDSSAYDLELVGPDGRARRIGMDDDRVEYVPAGPDGENRADIYFRPELLQDGEYTLRVRAADIAGNAAGRLDYEQSFEVINDQLVSNVLAYPNPFTTQTQFVYTLTGSVPPEVFRIQIMTVSGRVVRDIDLMAQENIRIGTHRTDFTWDGTDEYGDLLANGVYLYRVITSDTEGAALEAYDTGTDQYFRNGLGKVVILR